MKLINAIILICVVIVSYGCTSVQYKELEQLPEVKKDKGMVYFFRDKKFMGAASSYYVYEGNKETPVKLGALKNGTFFYIEPEPGQHTYWADLEVEDKVSVDIEAGQTYYIQGEIQMGVFAPRPHLYTVYEHEAKPIIQNLQYTVLD